MIWVNRWIYKLMEGEEVLLCSKATTTKYRWNQKAKQILVGLEYEGKEKALKAWKTKGKRDPGHMLVEKQTYTLLEEGSWLLPHLCFTEKEPVCLSIAESSSCFPCSPSQWLAPVHPKWDKKMVDVLPLWGRSQHRTQNSYYRNWEMKTGFMPFLLCDLEDPASFVLQLSHVYNRDSNDFSTALGSD